MNNKLTFDEWYIEFQEELLRLSKWDSLPDDMDKEEYRESYGDTMTPTERAWQELEDMVR